MLTADQILTAIAPQFDAAAGRAAVLELATARTPSGIFPTDEITNNAIALLAAHILTVSAGVATGGPVISKSVGPLRIAYASPWGAFGPQTNLATTLYGRELEELRKSYIMNPLTRIFPLPPDDSGDLG
jgi:hypothetical protein